jgi:hypothetical protein
MKYAVLLSAASEMVYGPELVCPERFNRVLDAADFAQRIKQASGLEYEIMHSAEDGWRSTRGETAVEVIRRRWQ